MAVRFTQTLPLDVALQKAATYHQAGRWQEAEQLYRAVLQAQPDHPDANHNLGLMAMRVGRHADGLPFLKSALAANPAQVQYALSYAEGLLASGHAEEALEILQTAMQRGHDTPAILALRQRAEAAALEAAATSAAPAPAAIDQLVVLFNAGRFGELEGQAQLLVNQYPGSAVAWKALGISLQAQGKDALTALHKAVELVPEDAEAHCNLAIALQHAGRLEDAVASYARALKIKPDLAEVHSNLGNALQALGRLDDAAASYRRALELKPDLADASVNLGNALRTLGQIDDAVASYRRALQIKPNFPQAHSNLGNALQDLGLLDDAVASYRRALDISPDAAETHNNLGLALHALGNPDDAVACYRRALQIEPDYTDAHVNLGNALQDRGQIKEALASYRRALEIEPDYANAHVNLGNALQDLGHLDHAVASYRRALEIRPDFAEAHSNLGNVLSDLGEFDDAVASYRRAVGIKPDLAEAHSSLLFLMAYRGSIPATDYLLEAKQWETRSLPKVALESAQLRDFERGPRANRRLRVGYVSGDFRQHPVSYFVEQLFAHHDRARIELFAYPTSAMRDQTTEKMQSLADHWHSLVELSDEVARARIEADQIDVLIDLCGHTMHNRLGVFARRAAPVQAHYLGYFASTGLTQMDYWIGDEILTPAGSDSHFSERVWRLPRVWMSYEGKADAPVPAWRPSADGALWLGSFNNLGKLTPATLGLWAQVLRALPEGKLLLKNKDLADANNRQRILDAMSVHGILPDRIELQDSRATPAWSAHMAYYDRLDVALDPVGGMGGATTTCDALWMGAPVIALEGDRIASRMTVSLLDAVGRPQWIARSEPEYIDKVVALARDVDGRKALRSSQRARMAASPLCDARGLAASLETAYVEMFERRLERKH